MMDMTFGKKGTKRRSGHIIIIMLIRDSTEGKIMTGMGREGEDEGEAGEILNLKKEVMRTREETGGKKKGVAEAEITLTTTDKT